MNNTIRERCGIPFIVRIRAYSSHALTALVAIAAYLLIFAFIAANTTMAAAEIRRANDAPHNEIILAGEPNGEESFIYLKNYAISGEKGKNAVSDVLMLLPNTEYSNNNIYFRGKLENGTCAVSANIAAKYGLDIGDTAHIIGTYKTFTVSKLLTAQDGIDEDYMHEGLIVLAYEKELLDRNYMYMSFMTDGDAYRSLDTIIYTEDMKNDSIEELILYAAVALFSVVAVMMVSEFFLFRSRRDDYKTLSFLGTGVFRLFMRIFTESILRYTLPSIIVSEIFAIWFSSYTEAYYIPASLFVGVCTLLSVIYSFVVIRRLYYVKSK